MASNRKAVANRQQIGPKFDEMTVADRARSDGVTRPALIRVQGAATLTDEHKAIILDCLRSGMTLSAALIHNPELPGAPVIQAARRADEAFNKAYDEARLDGLEAAIDEATDYSFATRGNPKLSASAKRYLDGQLATAAAVAPKRYGGMVKLAGADGEALRILTVNYNTNEPVQALTAETVEAPASLPAPQKD
jgi:hypothetical protein